MQQFFTSESVTEGHPDKLCDQISDAVLDAILAQDPTARVACEVACAADTVLIMGEISTTAQVDIPAIARKVICDVGYTTPAAGFDGHTCEIITRVSRQSPDIALGVDCSLESQTEPIHSEDGKLGAGDQGMMFGYACNETPERMPLPISLAHALTKRLAEVRRGGPLYYLYPDGKAQVTVEYRDGTPFRVDTIVVSAQHGADVNIDGMRIDIRRFVIDAVIPTHLLDEDTKVYINPTGLFILGGPAVDSGLTGRKMIVDTYGGYARHGGGAFSGKDPTKMDRSASYYARYIAGNVVAAGLATHCEVQLAYAIGVAKPVSLAVNTFGTGKFPDDKITAAVRRIFDARPASITRQLHLRRPIYRPLAAYGHMGRVDLAVPWEGTDWAVALKDSVALKE